MGTELQKSTAMQVKGLLEQNRDAIMAALPKHVSADRLMRVAIGAIARTPQLQECTPASLFGAIVLSATLGLEPSGPLGEAYLVPFRNSKKGCMEVQFIPGYRGLINLARRSGDVTLFYADKVCEHDYYECERGLEPRLVHRPNIVDRGEALFFYAVFHCKDGSRDFETMTIAEIDKVKAASKAKFGPWVDHYDEMAKKTVIRRLAKRAPMSVELAMAMRHDEAAAIGEAVDYTDVEDTTGIRIEDDAPAAMPEIDDAPRPELGGDK